jgi:hypothetical protein
MVSSLVVDIVLVLVLLVLGYLLYKVCKRIRGVSLGEDFGRYKPLSRKEFNDMVEGAFDDDDDDDEGLWDGDLDLEDAAIEMTETWDDKGGSNSGTVKMKLDFRDEE